MLEHPTGRGMSMNFPGLPLKKALPTCSLHAGAQLRVQGLTLDHAVMPSAQLVASGAAPPAPLAFNISGGSSLTLDGCTVLTRCSNLGQFRQWVVSLPPGDTVDVQVGGKVCGWVDGWTACHPGAWWMCR